MNQNDLDNLFKFRHWLNMNDHSTLFYIQMIKAITEKIEDKEES